MFPAYFKLSKMYTKIKKYVRADGYTHITYMSVIFQATV